MGMSVIISVVGALIGTIVWLIKKHSSDVENRVIANETRLDKAEADIASIQANCVQHHSATLTEARLRAILKEELPLQFDNFKDRLFREMFEKEYIKPSKPQTRKKT
jgi:hypothetical protein